MEFLKSSELQLNAAGYLVSTTNNKPVTHPMFVQQQQSAHFTVELSKAVQGKSFKSSKVDSLEAIMEEVKKSIAATEKVAYITAPTKPTSKVNDELVQFALDFANFETEKANSEKLNELMQQFNAIHAIETVGDYFQEGLVKLSKIYTIEQIKEAVVAYHKATN